MYGWEFVIFKLPSSAFEDRFLYTKPNIKMSDPKAGRPALHKSREFKAAHLESCTQLSITYISTVHVYREVWDSIQNSEILVTLNVMLPTFVRYHVLYFC